MRFFPIVAAILCSLSLAASADPAKYPSKSKTIAPVDASDSAMAPESATSAGAGEEAPAAGPFVDDWSAPWVMVAPLEAITATQINVNDALQNPAQAWRARRTCIFADLTYFDSADTAKGDGKDGKFDFNALGYGAMAVVAVTPKVKTGLSMSRSDFSDEVKITDKIDDLPYKGKIKVKKPITNITALLAYAVTPVVAVGADFQSLSYDLKVDSTTTSLTDSTTSASHVGSSENYSLLSPGVVYHKNTYEVGLKFTPHVGVESDEDSVEIPRQIKLHGQFRLDADHSVGGSLTHFNNVNDDGSSKNNFLATVGGDSRESFGTFGLFLVYESASYRNNESISSFTVPHYGLQAHVKVLTEDHLTVLTTLGYLTGSGKSSKSEQSPAMRYSQNNMQLAAQIQYPL